LLPSGNGRDQLKMGGSPKGQKEKFSEISVRPNLPIRPEIVMLIQWATAANIVANEPIPVSSS